MISFNPYENNDENPFLPAALIVAPPSPVATPPRMEPIDGPLAAVTACDKPATVPAEPLAAPAVPVPFSCEATPSSAFVAFQKF
jgi:hypothetical protein